MHDVRRWSDAHPSRAPADLPPLVWMAAPDALRHARIDAGSGTIDAEGESFALDLVEPLPLNRAWVDASSWAWFSGQAFVARGSRDGARFVARTLWPEAFRVGPAAPPLRSQDAGAPLSTGLRAWIERTRRADAPYEAFALWQRDPVASDLTGKAVIGVVLNGAQGDDDEAHAGHFSLLTGRIADDGSIAHWLVDNFYALDIESEKGILAAPVPLDNHFADLNAGQSWYRPSWLLVAVLDDDRAAVRVQSALGRVYRQFWRHQLGYYHPTDNCTSIAVDTLRALGLDVGARGPTIGAVAPLLLPFLAWRERSLREARVAYDYLVAERTRLLPAVAFEAVADAWWRLVHGGTARGTLEREIARDAVALVAIRVPQFPSSRAWGDAPVASLDDYRRRLPADRAERKIVPVPARPFPDELRDDDLLPPLPHPSDRAVRLWRVGPLALAAAGLIALLR
jgi:hypothetical protein